MDSRLACLAYRIDKWGKAKCTHERVAKCWANTTFYEGDSPSFLYPNKHTMEHHVANKGGHFAVHCHQVCRISYLCKGAHYLSGDAYFPIFLEKYNIHPEPMRFIFFLITVRVTLHNLQVKGQVHCSPHPQIQCDSYWIWEKSYECLLIVLVAKQFRSDSSKNREKWRLGYS